MKAIICKLLGHKWIARKEFMPFVNENGMRVEITNGLPPFTCQRCGSHRYN